MGWWWKECEEWAALLAHKMCLIGDEDAANVELVFNNAIATLADEDQLLPQVSINCLRTIAT